MEPIMKTSLLFLVLCSALLHNTSADRASIDAAQRICCYNDTRIRIPLDRLESYHWTGIHCPLKHIVFVTVLKKHVCVNPEAPWVQRAMKHIDNNS